MSYASTTLTIVFFINLFLFLAGSPEVNSPMLGIMKLVVTGDYNFNWLQFFSWSKLLYVGIIAGIVLAVSSALSPASTLTGSFATIHVLTVIAISIFISFLAVPNFSSMGIPEPLNAVINIFFGFMVVMSIYGLFRGE